MGAGVKGLGLRGWQQGCGWGTGVGLRFRTGGGGQGAGVGAGDRVVAVVVIGVRGQMGGVGGVVGAATSPGSPGAPHSSVATASPHATQCVQLPGACGWHSPGGQACRRGRWQPRETEATPEVVHLPEPWVGWLVFLPCWCIGTGNPVDLVCVPVSRLVKVMRHRIISFIKQGQGALYPDTALYRSGSGLLWQMTQSQSSGPAAGGNAVYGGDRTGTAALLCPRRPVTH